MCLIWFGLWFRYGFGFRVPNGLASRKETETAPGQAFGRFLDGFSAQIDREIREIIGMTGIRGIRLEKTRSA